MSPKLALSGGVEVSEDGVALEVTEPTTPTGDVGPRFATLPEFVTGFITTTWIRDTGGVHWCASWWRHLEAQVRLEALWSVYEAARTSEAPSAMAEFLRIELDHHMAVLTSDVGPFRACDHRRDLHVTQQPWPVVEPPEGLFLPEPPPADQERTP